MDPAELSSYVDQLNTDSGFQGKVIREKVLDAARGLSEATTLKILKDLEDHRDEVKDPTAWVTSALRKASGASSRNTKGFRGTHSDEEDQKLRRRIGWLNGAGGGFEGAVIYDKVMEAASGLPCADILKVLKDLEDKKSDVKDPNAWVCKALRKAGGGSMPSNAPSLSAPPAMTWYGGPQHAWPSADADPNAKVRKRVQWLNKDGILAGDLNCSKVLEAACGLDSTIVLKVLKDVEENKDDVKDPTAYVTAALRKKGGGQNGGGGREWSPEWAYAVDDMDREQQEADQKLRKKIGWLNKQGGFAGALIYDNIMDAAGGLEFQEVFRQLQQLEEKRGSVQDPTAWVCHGLRKAAAKKEAAVGSAMTVMRWTPGFDMQWSEGFDATMDRETESKLHKRIKWLNGTGGFKDSITFTKVKEAAEGLDWGAISKITRDLEENKEKIKDPTAYVTAALRKARGGGQGGMPTKRRRLD